MSASFGSGLGYTRGRSLLAGGGSAGARRMRFGWLDGSIYLVHRAQVADANTGYACDPVLASGPFTPSPA